MMEHSKKSIYGMLMRFAKGSKRYFFAAVAAAAFSILCSFFMPQVVGFTVDSVIGDKVPALPGFAQRLYDSVGGREFLAANLIICAAGVVIFAALSGILNYFSRMGLAKGTEGFVRSLRDTLFTHIQFLPFSWHTKNLTGDIIQRCTSDVETTRRFVSQQLIEVVRTVILVTLALVIMFSMDLVMTLIVLAFIPLILAYTMFFYKKIGHKFLEADEAEGRLMVHVQENLTGVRVVRAFGRERFETDGFNEKNDAFTDKWITLGKTLSVFWGVGDIVSALQLLTVVTVGAYMAASGRITLGNFLVFLSYTMTIAWPVRQMGRTLSEMSKTGVSLKRLKEILDAPAEEEEQGALKPPLDQDIVFEHVSFSYDAKPVLSDLSFAVKKGTTFGILGATGSGKSTVTYLLNRLFDLPEGGGRITIGGVDIREIDRHYLRRNVGLVLQEPFLYSKTIFENIDIAARSRDMELVRKNAEAAAIHDSINDFTHGYETIVGERGVTLSGGQKQRIAIARTLMLSAPIMIFDDSMSNLDMETDAKITGALQDNTAGATVLLISHRISTLMRADTIMVLEDGKLLEIGSHKELVEKGGMYKRIYDLQSGTE
jgi:ATP-binding cassette subfamily B protein